MAHESPVQTASPSVSELLSTWAGNFQHQTSTAFTKLELRDYIRLVIIIGGYMLLRPYLMKIGAKLQERAHEKDAAQEGSVTADANDVRVGRKAAQVEIPGVESDDEEEEGDEDKEVGATSWGRKATLRQRKMIRDRLEQHEKMLRDQQEDESDKEIAEFLVD